jgi:hypothetical protein
MASSERSTSGLKRPAERNVDGEGVISDTTSNAWLATCSSIPRRLAALSASVRNNCDDQHGWPVLNQVRIAGVSGSATINFRKAEVSRYQTTPGQRSLRSSSRTSSLPLSTGTGLGRSSGGRRAGCTRPAAINAPAPVAADAGARIATSRPRSVTPIVSPRSTRRSAAEACCCSSRTPMVSMYVKCSTKGHPLPAAP